VVNSVTYNSPTSVTLNLSTVAASPGAKNVTITNPDGQVATGVGILSVTSFVSLPTFVPIPPCRVVDTRNVGGAIAFNTSRRFNFYNDTAGFSWATQGGSAGLANVTCPGSTLTSAGGTLGSLPPTAAVLTITVVNPTAAGNFVVWGGGPANSVPNTSMLNWTAAGAVLANTGTVPAGGRGPVQDFEVLYNGPSGQADVVVDVVGYVTGNAATALQCTTQLASGTGSHANGAAFSLSLPACPTGYTATDIGCSNAAALPANVYLQEIAAVSARCTWFNNTGGTISATGYRAQTLCCRVPGQ
jgi:hypothetical protein